MSNAALPTTEVLRERVLAAIDRALAAAGCADRTAAEHDITSILDSMDLLELVTAIEEYLGCELVEMIELPETISIEAFVGSVVGALSRAGQRLGG